MALILQASTSSHSPSASSCTFSHPTTNHPNRILIVTVGQDRPENSINCDVTGVTYNGVALTKAVDLQAREGSLSSNSEIWYMLSPPVTTANIIASFPDSTNNENVVSAFDYYGAKQVAPEATAGNGTVTTSSVSASITPLTNQALVLGVASNDNQTYDVTPDAGQSEIVELKGNGGMTKEVSTKTIVTPGAFTFGVTASGSPALWSLAVASFPAAPRGAAFFFLG